MNLDTELIRQYLVAHGETILTWIVAGGLMLLLARFELRRAVRRSAKAMSESVATTVAACVPDVAHAAAQSAGGAGPTVPEAVESQRADALRRLSLDTVATVMARGRWLEDIGNLRLPDDALLAGRRAGGADPLLVVAPQRVVQAYLSAQRLFDESAADLQMRRREAQRLYDALQLLDAEAQQIDKETGSIVMRFEQVNAQPGPGETGGDYQRFLIQKYNALGLREKEISQERQHLRQQAREQADALADAAQAASLRYTTALAGLMEHLREAWGHGDSPKVFDTWLQEPGTPVASPEAEVTHPPMSAQASVGDRTAA